MRSELFRPLVATAAAAGLLLGTVTPALADHGLGLGLGVKGESDAHMAKEDVSMGLGTSVRTQAHAQRESDDEMMGIGTSVRVQAQAQRESDDENEDSSSSSGSTVGMGTEEEDHVSTDASFGQMVRNMRNEVNTLRQDVRTTLQQEHEHIADLSADTRANLFAKISTLIHDAFVQLKADIHTAITAAVNA
ncbi:MAG: hypothetical protein PHX87_00210 [Candidatus Peribacteraceae bacterium]|nr:hypothetical protein [Candidatus Peribacteraceae bacterium]MDD5741831.1 hypothetical protein [Candidatus Peribacteraceae bacterium]